jgi:HEAT repeat protein
MAVLYAIARDNELEYLAGVIAERHRELLVPLAWAAIEHGERDDRWQLAQQLGRIGQADEAAENVLLALVRDQCEYVRRMALCALARISSPHTESESLRVWELPDVDQQWARMMVLWCLDRVGSPMLQQLLVSAEQDARNHLLAYAQKVKHGIVDP